MSTACNPQVISKVSHFQKSQKSKILYVSQIKSKHVEYCKCLVKDILNYLIHLGTFWLRTIQRVLFIAFLEGMLCKNFSLIISSQYLSISLRHYTCLGFCKTSYHLLISPPPTNLPNTLKIHTGENKIDRQGRQYTCYFPHHYTRYFPANGLTNPDVFQPKTFSIPRGIIPQNFSSLGFAVSQELGNKQTHTQTHSLTFYCFDRVISYTTYILKCSLWSQEGGIATFHGCSEHPRKVSSIRIK